MTTQLFALAALLIALPSTASAQVTWTLQQPSAVSDADKRGILDLAAKAGLETPVHAEEGFTMPGSCRFVVVTTPKTRAGLCRSWQSLWLTDGTCGSAAIDGPATHKWSAPGSATTHTEWLIEDRGVQAWVFLREYYRDKVYTVSYDDARRVVIAFMRGNVIDARAPGARARIRQEPDLPVGKRAQTIDAVSSTDGGFTLVADGWYFNVVSEATRFRVTSASFPIP